VVGAPAHEVDGKTDQGSAYVFERDGAVWPQEKLEAPDGEAGDYFGYSVSVAAGLVAVGAPLSDVGGHPDEGAAYVFENDGVAWRAQAKLEPSSGRAGDFFGYSVAAGDEAVAVGAPTDAVGGNSGQGSAYVYARQGATWTELEKLEASDGLTDDLFGYAVAIGGTIVLVGARTDDVNAETDQGSTYSFVYEPCPAIALDPAFFPDGAVGRRYRQEVAASGGAGPYTYALASGSLPPGLTLDPSTGSLVGRPTAAGTYRFTIMATDGDSCPGSRDYTIVVGCAEIALGPSVLTLPPGTAGAPYGQAFTASGGTEPYTFSVSAGALPAGLTLDPSTGILFGTPEVSGEFLFAVEVTDAGGCSASAIYELTIECATLAVEPGGRNLPDGGVGAAYAQQFSAAGGNGSYRFDVATGALPDGLTLDPSTGELSGTPAAPGTFRFAIRATDGNGCAGRSRYRLVVN
jgi:hypothetical protein